MYPEFHCPQEKIHPAKFACIIIGMTNLAEIRKKLALEKDHLQREFGVEVVGIFGSYVRSEQKPSSDIDILVDLERPARISLIGLIELEEYLSQVLGIKVDIVLRGNLRKRIGKRILDEVVPV
jgi:uncharacterized protein